MKKVLNFALYDFANSAFTTIIITFIFSTYFAKQIAPNPILGQSYWGWTIGVTGILVAIIGPILGSFADKKKLYRILHQTIYDNMYFINGFVMVFKTIRKIFVIYFDYSCLS